MTSGNMTGFHLSPSLYSSAGEKQFICFTAAACWQRPHFICITPGLNCFGTTKQYKMRPTFSRKKGRQFRALPHSSGHAELVFRKYSCRVFQIRPFWIISNLEAREVTWLKLDSDAESWLIQHAHISMRATWNIPQQDFVFYKGLFVGFCTGMCLCLCVSKLRDANYRLVSLPDNGATKRSVGGTVIEGGRGVAVCSYSV